MTKSTTDHIVYDSTDSEFRCRHCEDKSVVQDGATAELCLMRLRGFLLMHKLCQPKAIPSPQLALPHTEPDDIGPCLGCSLRPCICDNAGARAFSKALQHELSQHAPSPDYGTEGVRVATCWSELWPQLKEALAPHEYAACVEWTPFPEQFDAIGFQAMAQWVAEELGNHEKPLGPRPGQMYAAVLAAVRAAQERHAEAAKAATKVRKPRARKQATA